MNRKYCNTGANNANVGPSLKFEAGFKMEPCLRPGLTSPLDVFKSACTSLVASAFCDKRHIPGQAGITTHLSTEIGKS